MGQSDHEIRPSAIHAGQMRERHPSSRQDQLWLSGIVSRVQRDCMVTMSDDTAMPQDKPAKMGTILAPSAATSTTAIPAQSRFLFWRPLPLGVGTKFSGATTPSGG